MQEKNYRPSKLTQSFIQNINGLETSKVGADELQDLIETKASNKKQIRWDIFLLWDIQLAIWFLTSMSALIFLAPFSTVKNYQPFKDIGIFSIAISSGYVMSKPIANIRIARRNKNK